MHDEVPSIKLDDRQSKRGCIGCLLLVLIAVGTVTTFVYFQFHPRDRITIAVKSIPVDTRFLCIVAETDEGIIAMNWSPSMVVPFEMEPRDCTMSYVMGRPEISDWSVMWKFGSRYGVVTREPDKVWRVHWFQADEVPLVGRSVVLGEGAATFDILKARTEQLPAETLRQLGFEDMRWDDEK